MNNNYPSRYSADPRRWSARDVIRVIEKEAENPPPPHSEEEVRAFFAPRLLLDLASHGLRRSVLSKVVAPIWSKTNYPFAALCKDDWRLLFEGAGYTEGIMGHLFSQAPRPATTQTLYRASLPEYADNFSWSADLELVRYWFVQRYRTHPDARIYSASVTPKRFLCRILDSGECVVETDGLEIVEHEDGSAALATHKPASDPRSSAAHAYRRTLTGGAS